MRLVLRKGQPVSALAGKGYEVVVPAVVTPRPGRAVRKGAAFQLARTDQRVPSLKVLGKRLAKQCALGTAWVVELGLVTVGMGCIELCVLRRHQRVGKSLLN